MISGMYQNGFTGCITNFRTTAYEDEREVVDLKGSLVNSNNANFECRM